MPADAGDRPSRGRRRDPLDGGTPDAPVPFGDYRLVGKIARGGMAEVYYGLPSADAQLLAIKCIRLKLAEEERFINMFIREGRLATLLTHPCIVRTIDAGTVAGRSFIAMHYIPGQDLNAVLRRCQESGRRVPVPHAVHIAASICSALHYAHELKQEQGRPLNIVNRDVSPSNIRLSYDSAVKLLDFGIAQAVMRATSEIGVLKGKFAYMSPEQIRGLPLDRRSDVFSTGVVLHEILTCERLFREESEFRLMEKVRQTTIKPPSALNPRVPAELDTIVMRALEREAQARYPDAQSMANALDPLLARYQFDPAELGEFVRSLFPAEYRDDQELQRTLLTGGLSSDPALDTRRHRRRRRPPRPRRRRTQPEPRRSQRAVWLVALTLLVAAGIVLIFALR